MTNQAKAQPGKFRGILLVKDKDGNVKFDDWNNIPEIYHPYLNEEDWKYIEEKQNGSNP